jgi:hypothetical protein
MDNSPSMERQKWLESALYCLRAEFGSKGYNVPDAIRISIGWPKGARGKGNSAIGQCWSPVVSSDSHAEIFVSPALSDSVRIMGVLTHEVVHAVVGNEAGHKAPFKRAALAMGLEGKMTATTESQAFVDYAKSVIDVIGEYPAGNINPISIKKQTTRLVKCACEGCGYTVRTTRKWIDLSGAPICPTDNEQMICDGGDEGEGDE